MASRRRILSLWFPRLAAERVLRHELSLAQAPFAVVAEVGNFQSLGSLSADASAAGLTRGQALRDARAMCPDLVTRLADPAAERAFLGTLRRWAGKFSPWVAEEPPEGLLIDLSGCAHLFGGEAALVAQLEADCSDLGLTVRAGLADTVGASWALARFAGQGAGAARSGDDIDQEARATRSRAGKRRHWTKGGAAPPVPAPEVNAHRIAPPGQMHRVLTPLPVAALRLDEQALQGLARVGLRQIGDLIGMPRAALARRFGVAVTRRLDQALGHEPEPVSPARPDCTFAVRLTLPDPIGLAEDIEAALDRLIPELAVRLRDKGRGVRRLRLEFLRADRTRQVFELGLARPSNDPARVRPLVMMKLPETEPGYGIDVVRLEALQTEPLYPSRHRGHSEAAAHARARVQDAAGLDDLIGRLGARVGLDAITRWHPADSHIPEKSANILAAAWSEPADAWPAAPTPRPLTLFRPEPVRAPDMAVPPDAFRWRGRDFRLRVAIGPERIAPEWWLDDPNWRSGVRDYWRVDTDRGTRLWLYYAHGAGMSSGWFCHGEFA